MAQQAARAGRTFPEVDRQLPAGCGLCPDPSLDRDRHWAPRPCCGRSTTDCATANGAGACRGRAAAGDIQEEEWAPEEAGARSWLEEADALAREGRFAEAIHHLAVPIDRGHREPPTGARPSGAHQPRACRFEGHSGARARPVCRHCALVERSLFGGRPVGESDWLAGARSLFGLRPCRRRGAHERRCDPFRVGLGRRIQCPRRCCSITAIGVLAFIAMLVLGAYAPDLRSGHNGGAHALSNAAIGFSGLVRLAEETGRNPVIVRSDLDLDNEDLAVVTPEDGSRQSRRRS